MRGSARCPDESTGKAGFCTESEAPYGKAKARLDWGDEAVMGGTLEPV